MQDLVAGAPQAVAAAPAASGHAAAPAQRAQQQAAAGWARPQHERAASQGWADFAGESSSAGATPSSVHARQESGSGSWATFSPKRGEEGQSAVPTASAGSFWSSFGEEAPGDAGDEAPDEAPAAALLLHEDEESASPRHQPLLAPQEAHVSQAPPAQPQHHSQSAPHRLVAAAAAAAASVASAVTRPLEAARTPGPARAASPPAPPSQLVDSSPLSAGLSRMSRVSQAGEASVAKPPAPTPSTASAPVPSGEHAWCPARLIIHLARFNCSANNEAITWPCGHVVRWILIYICPTISTLLCARLWLAAEQVALPRLRRSSAQAWAQPQPRCPPLVPGSHQSTRRRRCGSTAWCSRSCWRCGGAGPYGRARTAVFVSESGRYACLHALWTAHTCLTALPALFPHVLCLRVIVGVLAPQLSSFTHA